MKQKLKRTLGLWRARFKHRYRPGLNRRLIRFYRQFVQPGDICFDIGAHFGNRLKAWLDMGAQRVVGLEPHPVLYRELRDEFGLNNQVNLLPYAAGSKPGKALLHVSYFTPAFSTLAGEEGRAMMRACTSSDLSWEETVEVEVVTLDELIHIYGRPSFVKVDVAGMEHEVLYGLSHPVRALSFKYYSAMPYVWGQCMRVLRSLGEYEYNWSFGGSLQLNSVSWLGYEELFDILDNYTSDNPSGEVYARLST